MEDIYHILSDGQGDLWGLTHSSSKESLDVIEFWLDHLSGKVEVHNRTIGSSAPERHAWLARDGMIFGRSLIARFIWLVGDIDKKELNLSKKVHDEVLKIFDLELAYRYCKTFTSGVTALPRRESNNKTSQAYAFCYGPKIAAIWRHSQAKESATGAITEGIIITGASSSRKPDIGNMPPEIEAKNLNLRDNLAKISWNPLICRSASLPAYLFSIFLSQQIDVTQANMRNGIIRVESATGFHGYTSRQAVRLEEDDLTTSVYVSGYATKLASLTRKSQIINNLLEFILKVNTEEWNAQEASGVETDTNILQGHVDVLQHRLDMQNLTNEHIQRRVEIQIEALINSIAQKDIINSYKLARATYHDSSSMKTLAVVTMLFLPGNFVSALFSTDCFNWEARDLNSNEIRLPLTPQLTLYWAITLPLTLCTFMVYFVWLGVQKKKREREFSEIGDVDQPLEPTDGTAKKISTLADKLVLMRKMQHSMGQLPKDEV